MSRADFDWQFGEGKWDDAPPARRADGVAQAAARGQPDSVRVGRSARRRWPFVALGVLLAAGVIALLVVARRVEDATQSARQDVLAAHGLVRTATAQSDSELLDSLLSRADPAWRRVYQQLAQQGALLDRRPLGLHAQRGEPGIVDVTLSPDLTTAEVTSEQSYSVNVAAGAEETVRLRHTSVYVLRNQRWQLAPPDDDFWGSWLTSEGQRLTLIYPERDEAIARRLAVDLDAILSQLCGLSDIACPAGWRAQLQLDRELSSWLRMVEEQPEYARAWNFNLPTSYRNLKLPAPTIVGAPADESGYRALLRGYGVQLVLATITERAEMQPSWPDILDRARQDSYFVQLGLRPWPSIAIGRDSGPAPTPLPEQDIAVYCLGDSEQGGSLYRYNPTDDTWSRELAGRSVGLMVPLPDDSGIILQERASPADSRPTRIALWQRGRERVVLENAPKDAPVQVMGWIDPRGRYLLVQPVPPPLRSAYQVGLLDLASCTARQCEWQDIAGWASWSPDGSQTLVQAAEFAPGTLYRGDEQGQQRLHIGEGFNAFWLDDDTYGYVRQMGHSDFGVGKTEVVTASVQDDAPHVLLDSDALASALGVDEAWHVAISLVRPSPKGADWLSVMAYAVEERPAAWSYGPPNIPVYVVLFNRWTGDMSLQLQSDATRILNYPSFSPDGRWLLTDSLDSAGLSWTVYQYGTDRGDTRAYTFSPLTSLVPPRPAIDWSADGRWLAILVDGVLHLVAPEHGYVRAVVPDAPGCIHLAWINRP